MRRIGEHAVVIGGSVAGLLAARALTEAYDRVTVIDRDALPDGVADRRAVPQGRHAHALLPLGQRCLEQLLPGAVDALVADGAASCAALEEYRFVVSGSRLAPVSTGNRTVFASRPFIEGHVRARVRALPGVALRDRCDVLGLLADGSRVTGVRILRRAPGSAEERLAADLVVAASGRAARVPAWLEQLGWERPDEERLPVDVGYASRFVRLPEGALGDERMLLTTATPEWPRALYVFPQEGGRHIVSVGGYGAAHRPPADPAAFMAFVLSVAPPDLQDVLAGAEPLSDVATHAFPVSVRRRYERLARFPDGLLVCGDAIASFNPTYGQGMSVAAAEAVTLRDCLAAGERGLARRFFTATARGACGDAWDLATGSDLALPQVAGPRPLRVRVLNAYLRRLRAAAVADHAVAGALIAVIGLVEQPRTLLAPGIVRARGAWPAGTAGAGAPAAARHAADRRRHHAAARGRPGGRGRGGRLPPRQPRLGRRLGAAARHGRRARPSRDRVGRAGLRRRGGRASPRPSTTTRRSSARRSTRSGSSAPTSCCTTSAGRGACAGRSASRSGSPRAVLLNTGALPGYRWHALARVWRARGLGEAFNATTTRAGFRMLMRRGQRTPLPAAFVDRMYDDFDRGTRRAVLELYRSVADVAESGRQLSALLAPLDRPALVLWGDGDPYIGVEHAERQRLAFPRADVRILEGAGHWPFVDRPAEVAAALLAHLDRGGDAGRAGGARPCVGDVASADAARVEAGGIEPPTQPCKGRVFPLAPRPRAWSRVVRRWRGCASATRPPRPWRR